MNCSPRSKIRRLGFLGFNGHARRTTFITALVLVSVVGLVLRIHYVINNALWTDEITSLFQITRPLGEFGTWYEAPDPHPPLYYTVLRMVRLATLGRASELTIRLASLSLFLLVPLAALIYGWRHKRRRLPVLIAVALLAVSPSFVYLGAELRMYGLLISFVFAMTLLSIDWLERDHAGGARILLLATLALAATLTQYAGAVVAFVLGLTILVVRLWRDHRIDFGVVAAGAVTVAMTLPILGILRDQFAFITRTLYSTPLGEATVFFLWGLGAIGVVTMISTLASIAHAITMPDRYQIEPALKSISTVVPGIAFVFLGVAFVVSSAVLDIDLHNFGVSGIPPLLLVMALASGAAVVKPRWLVFSVLAAAVVMAAASLWTNQDSSRFESNRVPTVTAFDEALNRLKDDFVVDDLTIVHIDWARSNEYFGSRIAETYENPDVILITIAERAQLAELLISANQPVLVVTRLPLDSRILPQAPQGSSLQILSPNAVLISTPPA